MKFREMMSGWYTVVELVQSPSFAQFKSLMSVKQSEEE